jgi:hypothetical protein
MNYVHIVLKKLALAFFFFFLDVDVDFRRRFADIENG